MADAVHAGGGRARGGLLFAPAAAPRVPDLARARALKVSPARRLAHLARFIPRPLGHLRWVADKGNRVHEYHAGADFFHGNGGKVLGHRIERRMPRASSYIGSAYGLLGLVAGFCCVAHVPGLGRALVC